MKKIKLTKMQLFIILLFCVSMTIQTPAVPTLPGNGKIAFTSDRDGNQEIYLMNADGSGQTRLTNNSVRDDYPTWSPDGRTIAFVRENGGTSSINLMNADGTNIRELTTFNTASNYASSLSWSPNGTKIAFGYSRDIYAINIDSNNRVNLTNGQFNNYDPSWSADGTRIAFTRTGNYQGYTANIYTMNADGSDVREITPYRDYFDYGISPDYSPDNRQIALAVYSEDLYGFYGISLVNADGTNPQFLSVSGYTYSPKWSPDGTKFVFRRNEYFGLISQIWVINKDGSGLTQLTNASPNNLHPDWQPMTPELGLIVTRSDDRNATCVSGDCSLREAVNAANASATDDTINFASGLTKITLTNEIIINNAGKLTINGTGANVLTIDGGAGTTNRIFYTNRATVTISGVTLTGGNGIGGGGIYSGIGGAVFVQGGFLTLDGVQVTGNSSRAGGGVAFGGGDSGHVFPGTNRIINSTISGNTAAENGGGIWANAPLTIVNSTISSNRATVLAGGYDNEGPEALVVNSTISGNTASYGGGFLTYVGYATLRSVTITNNTAQRGGGIYQVSDYDYEENPPRPYPATLNLGNTIVAGNTATTGIAPEIYIQFAISIITSAGGNLVGDSPGDSTNTGDVAIAYQPTDIRDINPMLGALVNNGGLTRTHALLAGSPAIDRGINALVSPLASVFDQRGTGFARIRDGNGDGTATVDIGAFEVQPGATANRPTPFDFDGDGKADVSVFRPANGAWYLQQSANGFSGVQFGFGTDKLTPADYDGDGKTDVAVYRNGTWYLQRSGDGFLAVNFGLSTDVPMPADFSGDGGAEIAFFRPSNGGWYIYNLANNQVTSVQFGQAGDVPVATDYDGDGRADVAVFRSGIWYIQRSRDGLFGIAFGQAGDKPVPADYDGDGKTDIAVFRPSNGTWYLLQSTAGFKGIQFGFGTDLPVPADYDGDGKAEIAVFRDGIWYIQRSQSGFTGIVFGEANDKPAPNAFVP